jgi:hypothetical protein
MNYKTMALKDIFTEGNLHHLYGSLSENFNAIKTSAKKIRTVHGSTGIWEQASSGH